MKNTKNKNVAAATQLIILFQASSNLSLSLHFFIIPFLWTETRNTVTIKPRCYCNKPPTLQFWCPHQTAIWPFASHLNLNFRYKRIKIRTKKERVFLLTMFFCFISFLYILVFSFILSNPLINNLVFFCSFCNCAQPTNISIFLF